MDSKCSTHLKKSAITQKSGQTDKILLLREEKRKFRNGLTSLTENQLLIVCLNIQTRRHIKINILMKCYTNATIC